MKTIYIPSKGRPQCQTAKTLSEQNIQFVIVVEPDELQQYKEQNPNCNFLILPQNNFGLSNVRNYILNYAKSKGEDFFWMIDDDVTSFYTRQGTKLFKNVEQAFTISEALLNNKVGQIAMEYRQFAWSANKDFIENSYADVCVCINTNVHARYRNEVLLKEDRDFTMQIIKSGMLVLRSTIACFSAPKNGSNKGGLFEYYASKQKEIESVEKMIEIWGENICAKQIKNDGRVDCKIHWSKINSNQTILF